MKVLMVTDPSVFDINTIAPEFVEDELGKYGDNGGDPDGNAWLPSQELPDEANEWLVAHNFGQMVEVKFANDRGVAGLGNVILEDEWAKDDNLIDMMRAIADAASPAGWAHFGSYGTMDSLWVLAQLPELAL